MRISGAELARYRSALDELAELAGAYVSEFYAALSEAEPGASVASVRSAMAEAVGDALNAFGDQASTLACDLFDEVMDAEGVSVESRLYDAIDGDMLDGKLRYFARALANGDAEGFGRSVTDLTEYYVKRSAYENMVRNCDANNVRYARVPSGRETCSFCFMLCSRGFVYHSEATAKGLHGVHPHCDCIVVPGVQGVTSIDGYDPDAMWDRWSECAKTVGAKADGKASRKAVMREVETRDWKWLYGGKKANVEYGAEWNSDERGAADVLGSIGFSVQPIARSLKLHDRKPDFSLNGVSWEMKNPKGNGFMTIYNQFKKAVFGSSSIANPQSDKLVVTNLGNEMTFEALVNGVERVMSENAFEEIKEVLAVGRNGESRRWKR